MPYYRADFRASGYIEFNARDDDDAANVAEVLCRFGVPADASWYGDVEVVDIEADDVSDSR